MIVTVVTRHSYKRVPHNFLQRERQVLRERGAPLGDGWCIRPPLMRSSPDRHQPMPSQLARRANAQVYWKQRTRAKEGLMTDQTSVDRLRQGVKTWNQWRWQHPEMRPDLSYTNLSGTDLSGADLSRAHLSYAILSSASLSGADLSETLLLHSL